MEHVCAVAIKPKAKGRGIAVLDEGDSGAIRVVDELTAAELAVYSERNAAVSFWLVKDASASIMVHRKELKGGASWEFNYQVCDCAAKYVDRGGEEIAIDTAKADAKLQLEVTWVVFCGGDLLQASCPLGVRPECVDSGGGNFKLECAKKIN